jgi:subfamily B ATP-binding cassette protein MsbA
MLDVENDVTEKPDAVKLQSVGSGVRYQNVTFTYGNEPVLRGIDLDVAPGEIVALVGGSGAGKSTFIDVLLGLHRPSAGTITAGGISIFDNLPDWQRQLAVVPQDVTLLDENLRANIAFDEEVDDERLAEALDRAQLSDLVRALPQGLDTEIGERGVRLSGGQRQRLAIARALFKDPPILVLDEATSALDTESERLVQQALNNLMQGRTTLVIAHRLSTIRRAHKIVVLDKGRIVETGTHEELLARRGVYRKLYDLQFVDDDLVVAKES